MNEFVDITDKDDKNQQILDVELRLNNGILQTYKVTIISPAEVNVECWVEDKARVLAAWL